jgi:hypothetical protein
VSPTKGEATVEEEKRPRTKIAQYKYLKNCRDRKYIEV